MSSSRNSRKPANPCGEEEEEEIKMYIKVIKTVAVKVKRSDSIQNVKAALYAKEGIEECLQELFFNGHHLKDNAQNLVDCGIKEHSTIHLYAHSAVPLNLLIVNDIQQETFSVKAKTTDTIHNVKMQLLTSEELGICPNDFTLVHDGRLLEDNQTLASLNIQRDTMLKMVLNPKDTMTISVRMPNKNILRLEVKRLHTIREVKTILESKVGEPLDDMDLTYAGELLEDPEMVCSFDIKEGSELQMKSQIFQIFVKPLSISTITLTVHKMELVKDVKQKIFKKIGVPVEVQTLMFNGRRLEDNTDLAHYKVEKDSTLHQMNVMRGGLG